MVTKTKESSASTKVTKMKSKLLKKQHTHSGVVYKVGTPLEKLKASDSDIQFMEKTGVI